MFSNAMVEIDHVHPPLARSEAPTAPVADELRFGPYRVIPGARLILFNGEPLKLGSRAFDILVVLLQARGTIVARDEIIRRVWPTTVVEDTNLRFQMGVLRRALGEHRAAIKTISGRGYLFALDVVTYVRSVAPVASAGWAISAISDHLATDDAEARVALRDVLRAAADEVWRAVVLNARFLEEPSHAVRER